jgi:hypothetical protein
VIRSISSWKSSEAVRQLQLRLEAVLKQGTIAESQRRQKSKKFEKEGALMKQGKLLKHWKQYWFKICDGKST